MRRGVLLAALAAAVLYGQPKKEEPVGLVLSPAGSRVVRVNTETPLSAKAGDILFSGDALRTEGGTASFLYCPGKTSQSLEPGGEVVFEARQLKVKAGKIVGSKPVAACFLPQVVRVAVASQQHYGISMTRGVDKPDLPPEISQSELPPAVQSDLAAIGGAQEPPALLARAAVFEKNNLAANALAEYRKAGAFWPDAVWVKGKIFELEESIASEAAAAAAKAPLGGQTFAVVVGISKYQRLPQELWLQFAHADAIAFEKHLRSPRGGGLPSENLMVLTDEKATTAALRNAFQTFLKGRAGPRDTVIVLIAGHGTVETPGSKGAFILTHDADPQDLSSTALPMADIQTLMQQELSKVGRVIVFVDVCRAGNIGSIRGSTMVNAVVERLGEAEGEIFGLMASRPKELSYEGPQFGGGHGAFSYFLLKALGGAGDKNNDGIVDVNELIDYVRTEVARATNDKQHPRDFGTMDNAVPLAHPTRPGIEIARRPMLWDSRYGEPLYLASAAGGQAPLPPDEPPELKRFSDAMEAGRLLPNQPGSAMDALRALRSVLSSERYLAEENRLRVALEDRSQQVLLRYLAGEEAPQTRDEFEAGAAYLEAAALLTPESLFLDARQAFFRGRSLLFDKQYQQAADLLERSIRIDPLGAYAYNALGIAYLEQADFKAAMAAFQDAIARAPHWAYPLHNFALASVESGDYAGAIRAYQRAMKLMPGVSYLPYNLGLVYQRLNRTRQAEAAYRTAMKLAPQSGEPLNALGALKASAGKAEEAERFYRQALEKNPALFAARHNLALVLAARKDRQDEAVELWRGNLKSRPDHVASRISLAELLTARGQNKAAIAEFREVLRQRPEYVAARLALAGLMDEEGDAAGALRELREALREHPNHPGILEQVGDVEAKRGNLAEARRVYEEALTHASGADRKRLRGKLKR